MEDFKSFKKRKTLNLKTILKKDAKKDKKWLNKINKIVINFYILYI